VPGAEPGASLLLAHLLLDRGDGPGALAALERVEAELLARPDAEEGSLVYLAQLYGRSESCTAAERVAARAKDAEGARRVAAECGRLRTWIGLAAGDRLVPEAREAEYVSALRAAHRDVEAGRLEAARRRASEVERAFPGAAGPAVVRCAAAARAGYVVAARTACGRAARAAPSAAYPQYVLGLVASAEGRWVDARAYLSRALALDDAQPDVWTRLALVHRRLGETGDLEALRARHRARFGEDLKTPPAR
jgi:tetratricopeptide (TPR) repeat protein